MKLPNPQKAIVDREKITDYLLNPAHPDNGGKFKFFTQLGFLREQPELLTTALKALAEKYVIVGRIQSPSGNRPLVQSIWIVDKGLDAARLVTAYPHKERPHD
jgi:hypothetical protein